MSSDDKIEIGYKIRAVRSRKTGDMGSMTVDEFVAFAKNQIDTKSKDN